MNFYSDKYWSFCARSRLRPGHAAGRAVPSRRVRRLTLGAVLAGLSAVVFASQQRGELDDIVMLEVTGGPTSAQAHRSSGP